MWRRLRIAKRDETFPLIFFPGETEDMKLSLGAVEPRGPHKPSRRGLGVAAVCGLVAHWSTSSGGSLCTYFSLIPEKISVNFQDVPRTFSSAQKQHHGNSAENSVSPG